jgi:hypothetical protein
VFLAEEIEGEGDKGSGDSTMTDVELLMEAFLKTSLRCFCERIYVKCGFLSIFLQSVEKTKIH